MKTIPVDHNTPKDELTDREISEVIKAVAKFEKMSVSKTEDLYGLPYTSSSAFAGLWNTNTEREIEPGQYIQGFTLAKDGRVICLTHTRDEQESWYVIGEVK